MPSKWITVNGTHVPIEKGETKNMAAVKFLKQKGNSLPTIRRTIYPNGNKKVLALYKKLKPYTDNEIFTFVDGRSVPKNEKLRKPFIKLWDKLEAEMKKNKLRQRTSYDYLCKGIIHGMGLDDLGNKPLTKAEKELGGYLLLDHLDSKGRLPNLKKITKYAKSHKDESVRKAAEKFQAKYGNAPLSKQWFAGQYTMLPKDKAGYIRAHRDVFEKEFYSRNNVKKSAKDAGSVSLPEVYQGLKYMVSSYLDRSNPNNKLFDKEGNYRSVDILKLFAEKGHPENKGITAMAKKFQKNFGNVPMKNWRLADNPRQKTLLPADKSLHEKYKNAVNKFVDAWYRDSKKGGWYIP